MHDYEADRPAEVAGERETLDSWLEFHRATLARKCEGLTDDQLREQSVPPSTISLLGLVRHMAEVERGWFQQVLAGEDVPDLYVTPEDQGRRFHRRRDRRRRSELRRLAAECELARKAVAAAPSLDLLAAEQTRSGRVSLRWIMVHMIEEYARHNGHADLLRERIDGATGD